MTQNQSKKYNDLTDSEQTDICQEFQEEYYSKFCIEDIDEAFRAVNPFVEMKDGKFIVWDTSRSAFEKKLYSIKTDRSADVDTIKAMTTPKTASQIISQHYSCCCDEIYKSRQMEDPSCTLCEHGPEIELMMQEYAAQQSRLQAIALLKFLRDKYFEPYLEHWTDNENQAHSDEQTVDLFLIEQAKQKEKI